MSVRGSIGWAAVGALGSAAALVASPGTYEWLRRRAGLEQEQRHYYAGPDEAPDRVDEPVGDARLSLRARLQEVEPPAPAPRPERSAAAEDGRRLRLAVDETRARAREKAAAARRG